MSRWDDFIEEKPSQKHKDNVFAAVSTELEGYRQSSRRSWIQSWMTIGVWGSVAAAIALITFRIKTPQPTNESKVANESLKLLEDIDLVENLELMEDLDVVELMDELSEEII